MSEEYFFQFGQKVQRLEQRDRSPKEVFILGVYSSAVHAIWKHDGKQLCRALAVASEPCIFWNGDISEAERIISSIKIESKHDELSPAAAVYNGPSGRVLDERILKPLRLDRSQAWLCNLLPEARLNPGQFKRITEDYNPLIKKFKLNEVTVPKRPNTYCNEARCNEITEEIRMSGARKIILLGDIPIKQYLKRVAEIDFKDLKEYTEKYDYGTPYSTVICDMNVEITPITHPRNIGRLGKSVEWCNKKHIAWENKLKRGKS